MTRLLKQPIVKYFMISLFASIIDLLMANIFYKKFHMDYLIACNLGILFGFIFQYFITMNYVFKKKSRKNPMIVYFITFFLGLALADGTMWVSYHLAYLSFFISKLLSMGVPFFIIYFIRRRLLGLG